MTPPLVNSQHYGITTAIAALLSANTTLAGIPVNHNRRRPMAQETEAEIFVYREESPATIGQITGAPVEWRTRVRIECVARDTATATADRLSDAIQTAVYAALQSSSNLGGTALDIEPQAIGWTGDEADTTVAACQAIYSIWHTTANNTIA